MKALARLPLLQALSWFLYLGGWIVLGGLARMLTAGPWQALGLLLLWLLLLALFARLQPVVAQGPPGRSRLMHWLGHCLGHRLALSLTRCLPRSLPLLAALAAARGIAAALDGAGLQGLLLALPAWAWLSVSAWTQARRAAAVVRPPARAQAAAACVGAALLWLCAGDIADLRASCMRLAWAALAAGLVLALMQTASAAAKAKATETAPAPGRAAGARKGWRDSKRPHAFPAIGCLGFGTERPAWPLALASLAMLPMMCGLALWPELCGSDSLPADAALGLHLLAMFAPALLLSGARIELAAATPAACTALLMAATLALHWLPAGLPEWALAWLPGVAWSLLWLASLPQQQKIPVRLAGPAEAP